MRINLILQKGGALNRDQWHGAAEALSLHRGVDLSFVGFHPPFVKKDIARVRAFGISGILGMFGRADYAEFVRKLGVPAVSICGGRPFAGIPQVGTDDREIGKMAAEHLSAGTLCSHGYFGLPELRSSRARWAGFSVALRERGKAPRAFRHERELPPRQKYAATRLIPWEAGLYGWIERLPKPSAVFCYDDLRAYWVAGACVRMGLKIPDEVSVLGVGDDPGYVFATTPHLSSIAVPYREEGAAGAELLRSLVDGRRSPPEAPIFLSPAGVVERASTDVLRAGNSHVRSAMRFIRDNRGIGISVGDAVARGGCCRKVMERLFRQHLGSTILAEIRREQIGQVRALLRCGNAPIEQIAEECGYSSLNHLARDFKKRTGISPGRYRRNFQNPER